MIPTGVVPDRVVQVLASAVVATLLALVLRDAPPVAGLGDALVDRSAAAPQVSPDLLIIGLEHPVTLAELGDLVRDLRTAGAAVIALTEVPRTDGADGRDIIQVDAAATEATFIPRMDAVPFGIGGPGRASTTPRWVDRRAAVEPAPTHVLVPRPANGGAVRLIPLTVRTSGADGERFLALAAAVTATASGATPAELAGAAYAVVGLDLGGLLIPDEDGALRIRWASALVTAVAGTTARLSDDHPAPYVASDALDPRPGSLAGRVVLIGSTSPDAARYALVPGGPPGGVPEVWVHANAVNTVLTGGPLVPLPLRVTALAALALALLAALATRALPWWSAGAVLAGTAGVWIAVVGAAARNGLYPDAATPVLALVLAGAASFAVRYVTETRHRRRVADLFASYVPATVARELMADPAMADRAAAGERADISVWFCDLRGFTATAAQLEPGQVKELLEVYYRHAGDEILAAGGTVLQYVGDEVFAIFGAPLPQDDHPARAVACAIAVQERADRCNADLAARGLPSVAYGIGVQSGPVVAAHLGTGTQRRQYSVIGDTVNVGARLCSQAAAGQVVVSQDVVDRLADNDAAGLVMEPLGAVPLKGIDRDLPIHRVTRRKLS